MNMTTTRLPTGLLAAGIIGAVFVGLVGGLGDLVPRSLQLSGYGLQAALSASQTTAFSAPELRTWAEPQLGDLPTAQPAHEVFSLELTALVTGGEGSLYTAGALRGACRFGLGVEAFGGSMDSHAVVVAYGSDGSALWTRTADAGAGHSRFESLATGDDGTVYAAGLRTGAAPAELEQGLRQDPTNAGTIAVLAAYDPEGRMLWKTSPRCERWNPWGFSLGRPAAPLAYSAFSSVAADQAGAVYAAGSQGGTNLYHYGEAVSVAATARGLNAIMVKYDASGAAQWARSICSGGGNSEFLAVAVDDAGYVYAAGHQFGAGALTYASGVSVCGSSPRENAVLVKYAPDGSLEWARIATGSIGHSAFRSVAVDSDSNVYVGGFQTGTQDVVYGSRVRVAGSSSGMNPVLVSFAPDGSARWARTATGSTTSMSFNAVAVGEHGMVHAVGSQYGSEEFVYGNGVRVAGASQHANPVLVTYTSDGVARWAVAIKGGYNGPAFGALAADAKDGVFLVARWATTTYTYAEGHEDTISTGTTTHISKLVAAVPPAGIPHGVGSTPTNSLSSP